MTTDFKCGDHVEWNSEAGMVRGTIQKKVTSRLRQNLFDYWKIEAI